MLIFCKRNCTYSFLEVIVIFFQKFPVGTKEYHHSIGEKPINADYSALSGKIETYSKSSKFKNGDIIRITKRKNIFSKGFPKNF